MIGINIMGLFGILIAFSCFVAALTSPAIIAGQLVTSAAIGLLIVAVSAAASGIVSAIRKAQREAAVERQKMSDALRLIAERRPA